VKPRVHKRVYALMERYCIACWLFLAVAGVAYWGIGSSLSPCSRQFLPFMSGAAGNCPGTSASTSCPTALPPKETS
jgi:hypothetical protein